MSDHKISLVPLATGYFQSPNLFVKDQIADVGLFAESLIYYDSVYVYVDNPVQFAGFISLLIQKGLSYEKLIELVEEGSLRFFSSVYIMPLMNEGRNDMVSSLWAVQEKSMDEPNYFSKKFLEFEGLKNSFSTLSYFDKKLFDRFCQAAEKTAISFNNEAVGAGIVDNAYEDFLNPKRNILIVKNLLKETFKANRLGKPPQVKVKITEIGGNFHQVAKNDNSYVIGRNFDENKYKSYEVEYNKELISSLKLLENTKTPLLKALSTLPLSGAGQANLIIRSANILNCDLFLASPVSRTIGDKIYEISESEPKVRTTKLNKIVDQLEIKVEFPKVRRFVNEGKIEFDKVLEIREKAKQFRQWLQSEADRDRDSIIAYHNEVAKKSGFQKIGNTLLNMFGVVASVGASIGAETFFSDHDSITKETTKKLLGKGIDSLTGKVSKKLFNEWKPICFGDWYKDEISSLLKKIDDAE